MPLSKLSLLFTDDVDARTRSTAIVFVHGYLAPLPNAYWFGSLGLMLDLRRRGVELRLVRAPVTATVAERAQSLASVLAASRATRVILVGHSMGGLDARYAASYLDPAQRITDVVTLGTPHRGTMLADYAHHRRQRLPRALRELDQGGLGDLTRAGARRFNEQVPDREDVRYHAICGRVSPQAVPALLRPFSRRLQAHEGDNDSLVAVASARWGRTTVVDDADHWSLIGVEWVSGIGLVNQFAKFQSGGRPLAVLRRRLEQILDVPP